MSQKDNGRPASQLESGGPAGQLESERPKGREESKKPASQVENGGGLRGRRIGLSGGAGAGKSCVLDWLRERRHAYIIRTDDVARRLMEPGEEGFRRVVQAFGACILGEDGRIDRPLLAQRIFNDRDAKETIDRLTHPLVWSAVEEEMDQAEAEGFDLIVVESALFEPSSLEFLDEIWLVDAPDEVRVKRMMDGRGYSRERCEAMLASQPDRKSYQTLASRMIDNEGSWEETRAELEKIFLNFS